MRAPAPRLRLRALDVHSHARCAHPQPCAHPPAMRGCGHLRVILPPGSFLSQNVRGPRGRAFTAISKGRGGVAGPPAFPKNVRDFRGGMPPPHGTSPKGAGLAAHVNRVNRARQPAPLASPRCRPAREPCTGPPRLNRARSASTRKVPGEKRRRRGTPRPHPRPSTSKPGGYPGAHVVTTSSGISASLTPAPEAARAAFNVSRSVQGIVISSQVTNYGGFAAARTP